MDQVLKNKLKKLLIVLFLISIIIVFIIYKIFQEYSDDWASTSQDKIPIIYSDNYDIKLFGLQKLHPFDSEKYSKVLNSLIKNSNFKKSQFYAPDKVSNDDLLLVHTSNYLNSLNNSKAIAQISEMGILSVLPNFISQERLLDPMRYATGGTVLGIDLALNYSWAINLSGGYHHTKKDSSGGFGFYADVPLAIHKAWEKNNKLKVLIIDLDAHQGNGNESILSDDPRVFILDVYREDNYPRDDEVKQYIDYDYPIGNINDKEYLGIINKAINDAIIKAKPNLIIYNAGTDIFEKDPIGKISISQNGIIKRDEIVFTYASNNKIPILMVLSGGYTKESSEIISNSVNNLYYNVINKHKNQ